MTAPTLLQIDDRNPLVFYSPNSSWTRGGNTADFDGTSTFTATTGASATLTFTGTGISVWGTIQFLAPNTPTYVLSSYAVDGGPTTTFNATETAGFQFQQKLFQSATLTDSAPHTLVVTLVNNGTLFIDYFLVIPSTSSSAGATSVSAASSNPSSSAGATSASASSSNPSSSAGATSASASSSNSSSSAGATSASASSSNPSSLTGTIQTVASTSTAGAGAQSNSSRVSLGPAVGGSLGGFALLIIAILAVWLCRKRRKDKNQMLDDSQAPVPFNTSAPPMHQHQPHEGSDTEHQSYSRHPTPQTSASGVIPSSKAAQLSIFSRPRGDPIHSRPFSESPEPPGYNE